MTPVSARRSTTLASAAAPLHATTFETPVGPFSVALTETGALVATAFGDLTVLATRLPSLAPQPFCHVLRDKPALFYDVQKQVQLYFAGKLCAFDLALAPHGTIFQHRVWHALTAIPFGETRSYGQLAAALGNPAASRAIGRANATNPICLIVPCHRVIGADGSLTGFAFGEAIKRRLLEHEGVLPRALL